MGLEPVVIQMTLNCFNYVVDHFAAFQQHAVAASAAVVTGEQIFVSQ